MLYNPWLGRSDPDVMARLGLRRRAIAVPVAGDRPRPECFSSPPREAIGLLPGIPVSPADPRPVCGVARGRVGGRRRRQFRRRHGLGAAGQHRPTLAPPVADEAYVCQHPVGGLYGQMLSMRNGGSAIQWVIVAVGDAGGHHATRSTRCSMPFRREATDSAAGRCLSGGPEINGLGRSGGRLAGITLAHSPRTTWSGRWSRVWPANFCGTFAC